VRRARTSVASASEDDGPVGHAGSGEDVRATRPGIRGDRRPGPVLTYKPGLRETRGAVILEARRLAADRGPSRSCLGVKTRLKTALSPSSLSLSFLFFSSPVASSSSRGRDRAPQTRSDIRARMNLPRVFQQRRFVSHHASCLNTEMR